jgi:hypothetical protein
MHSAVFLYDFTLSSNSCAGHVAALHAPLVSRLALAAVALAPTHVAADK